MNVWVRSALIVGLGLALLLAQSALGVVVSLHPFAPNVLFPIAFFLGVSPEIPLGRGAVIAFVLGYLLDLTMGYPMSLHTLLLVATFLLARGAGLRFFPRGVGFQVLLMFLFALVAGGGTVALRDIFEQRDLRSMPVGLGTWPAVLGSAVTTALLAPLIFAAVRRIEASEGTRREEPAQA